MILSSLPLYVMPLLAALGAALSLVGGAVARRMRIGLAALLLAGGALVAASVPLARGLTPFTAGPRVARIGSLDATLCFSLTTTTAFLAGAVVLGAGAVLVARRPATPGGEALVLALAASLLVADLADGYPAFVAGWLGFVVAFAALVGRDARGARHALTRGAVGSLFIVLSSACLFWALGGKFLDGRRYLADFRPRFVAVSDAPDVVPRDDHENQLSHLRPNETGELTMLTYPGASVYRGVANEAQLTPRFPVLAVSPFVGVKVPSGVEKIAIDAGPGTIIGGDGHDVALVDEVRFPPGSHVIIELVGPSVSFREIANQIAHAEGDIEIRKLGPLPLLDGARAALLLGLVLLATGVAAAGKSSPSTRALGGLGLVVLAGSLRDRLASALLTAWSASLAVSIVAALAACGCAVLATRAGRTPTVLARLSGWIGLLVATSIAFGPHAYVSIAGAAAALGAIGMAIAWEGALSLGGAPAAATASRPALAVLLAGAVVLGASVAFGAIVAGGASGIIAAALVLTSVGIGSFALFRALYALERIELRRDEVDGQKPRKKKKKRPRAETETEALPVVSVRTSAFVAATGLGMLSVSLWLARGTTQGRGALELLLAAAAVGVAAVGFVRARSVAGQVDFARTIERDTESSLGRIAEPVDDLPASTASTEGALSRIVLGIDAIVGLPVAGVGRFAERRTDDEKAS